MPATATAAEQVRWVSAAAASRAGNLSVVQVYRLAVVREIRTKLLPGRPPLFCLEDAIKARREPATAGR